MGYTKIVPAAGQPPRSKGILFWLLVIVLLLATIMSFSAVGGSNPHRPHLKSLSAKRSARAVAPEENGAAANSIASSPPPPPPGGGQVYKKVRAEIKYEEFKLPANYSRLQIPSIAAAQVAYGAGGEDGVFEMAISVYTTMRILSITEVDEINEEIIFNAALILRWDDMLIKMASYAKYDTSDEDESGEQMAALYRNLDPTVLDQLWHPDLFIERLVKVEKPELMSPPVSVRYNEVTGRIIYTARVRIKMECEMSFEYYPADIQKCKVVLRSSANDIDDLMLEWEDKVGVFLEECDEPNYDLQLVAVDEGSVKKEAFIKGEVRTFSTLEFTIMARRKLSYHLVQTFLPSVFFIIITWLCFLIPSRMVEARIGISMTTLLTLTAMFASVRESTPIVSYVRAIDIWMLACIFFVFLTLLEFSVLIWLRAVKEDLEEKVNKLNELEQSVKLHQRHEEGDLDDIEVKQPLNSSPQRKGSTRSHNSTILRKKMKAELHNNVAEFIERFAFLIFSLLFLAFNLAFWPWLLVSSEYFNWDVDKEINCPEIFEA